ncbi:HNH endonuclease signature motif containing protein [Zunongwangia sp. HGR-M22]|uniref:HNH endonuclease signature motif containing protein n=1 Tax=Zunongwangia sp. HGR-M22 TaxID=3015168 RepID=UPI0022DDAC1D|nr:HNH endonuclease [Zunongwangia sp. HGR-M22]WBL24277.1 HNH endonuclease [Zunongwangia sp. HGR-M22]
MDSKKKRISIPQKNKVRAELQKEIGSVCPFCTNSDVGHFQIHHIDEDPSNNDSINLLLICPNCHSRITKKDISKQEVIDKKTNLRNINSQIQFISVSIDEENCGWREIKDAKNAFMAEKLQSLFPVFIFSFINNSSKTLLLTNIRVKARNLPIGLSGPHTPLPSILRSSIKYKIKLPSNGELQEIKLKDELEVPPKRAFKFKIELFAESMEIFNPQFGRFAIFFEFGFNNNFYLEIPMILLNSPKYYEKLKYIGLA